METLSIVIVFFVGPLVFGGLVVLVASSLASLDVGPFQKLNDMTNAKGTTLWCIYPLRPFLWFNVWSVTMAGKATKLFRAQQWYLKLALIYTMGVLALLVVWMNDLLESLPAIGSGQPSP